MPRPPLPSPHRRDLARRLFQALPRLQRELLLMSLADRLTDAEIVQVYGHALTLAEVGTHRRAAAARFRRHYRAAARRPPAATPPGAPPC